MFPSPSTPTHRRGDLSLQLALGLKIHQNLVFDAAAGIGGQAHILVGLKGADALDQPMVPMEMRSSWSAFWV